MSDPKKEKRGDSLKFAFLFVFLEVRQSTEAEPYSTPNNTSHNTFYPSTMHVHLLLISLAACIVASAARHQNLRSAEPDVEFTPPFLSRNSDAGSPANPLKSGDYFAQAEKEQANVALTEASSFEAAHDGTPNADVGSLANSASQFTVASAMSFDAAHGEAPNARKLINDRTTNAFNVAQGDGEDGEDGDDEDDGEDDEEDSEDETDDSEAFQAAGDANEVNIYIFFKNLFVVDYSR